MPQTPPQKASDQKLRDAQRPGRLHLIGAGPREIEGMQERDHALVEDEHGDEAGDEAEHEPPA